MAVPHLSECLMKASRSNHAMRDVLTFLFRHWRREAWLVAGVAGAMLMATVADLFMPLFAGRLVDAVAMHASYAQHPKVREVVHREMRDYSAI